MCMHSHIIAEIREEGDFKHPRRHNCPSFWSVFAQYGILGIERMKGEVGGRRLERDHWVVWLEMKGGAFAVREKLTHGNSLLGFFSVSCLTYP